MRKRTRVSVFVTVVLAILVTAGWGIAQEQQPAASGEPEQKKEEPQKAEPEPAQKQEQQAQPEPAKQDQPPQEEEAPAPAPEAKQPPQQQQEPEGQVVPMPGLDGVKSRDVYQAAVQKAFFELSYAPVQRRVTARTEGLDEYQHFLKRVGEEERTLLIGLKLYVARDNEIVLWGQSVKGEAAPQANPDLAAVASALPEVIKTAAEAKKQFSPRELETEFYQLSFMPPANCLGVLTSLGWNTGAPKPQLTLEELPLISLAPEANLTTAVGNMTTPTHTGPHHRLMILYHRTQGDKVSELTHLIEETIDVPPRSVLIEAMVIELTEKAIKELGVEWEWEERVGEVSGSFTTNIVGETWLTLKFDEFKGKTVDRLKADLKALIDEREAEVLSAPSVLTLDNTQATINVTERIPILKTVLTEPATTIKTDVSWETVGIILKILPRISRDGSVVTMQIDTEVSDAPPREEWIQVFEEPVAPVIQERKVKTVAQVDNNTPFIIGGLIRDVKGTAANRIPVLSKIPILGRLFEVRTDSYDKREDIIVLTPRVLEPLGPKRPALPKDSARFDITDTRLFRNSYRLKADDVFDLDFVKENVEIKDTFDRACRFVRANPQYADQPPFDELRPGRLPGEEAVVVRMLYEIVKYKLKLHERIDLDRLIFFKADPEKPAGFDVAWLENVLKKASKKGSISSFFEAEYPKNVLIMRYGLEPGAVLEKITRAPVAEVEIREVQGRDEVEQLWLDENKMVGFRRPKTAIVLDTEKDLTRLKIALVVREIISVNEVWELLTIDNFQVGRRIQIPEIREKDERIFLLDHNVSQYDYETEFYYAAFQDKLRAYYDGIRKFFGDSVP